MSMLTYTGKAPLLQGKCSSRVTGYRSQLAARPLPDATTALQRRTGANIRNTTLAGNLFFRLDEGIRRIVWTPAPLCPSVTRTAAR
jgi:hypothetical protein